MQKGIILFDIDRTIFDTDKQSKLFYENILKVLGINDLQKLEEVKHNYKLTLRNDRDYVPDEYLKHVAKEFNFKNLKLLQDVYFGDEYSFIYRESVFPEVRGVLNKLKIDYRLGIYSEGTSKFQNNKFNSLSLDEYFDKDLIFIFDAKDTEKAINKIPKDAIVVDDKERICEFLTEHTIRAIWLNRNDDRVSSNFQTIHDLLELPSKL